MKRRLALALLAPAILLLSGCFTVETSYEVNEDGSGTQTMRLTIPAEVASSFGEELPDVEEMEEEEELQQFRDALGDDGSITFFSSAEEGIGFELIIAVEASEDFGAALEAKANELTALMPDEETGSMIAMAGNVPTLRQEGDEWIFEQSGEALDPALLSGLAGEEEGAGFAAMFLDQTTIITRVNLPGEVTEHNADEVLEDGTLVWTQTGADEPRTLMARSELNGGGLSTLAMAGLLIGAIAIVLLVAGFLLFGRGRKPA